MVSVRVVKPENVLENRFFRFLFRSEPLAVHTPDLDRRPEAFHWCVVIRDAAAGHTLYHPFLFQGVFVCVRGILYPSV